MLERAIYSFILGWSWNSHTMLLWKATRKIYPFKSITSYSSFAMGGNTLQRKSSVLDLPIRKSTCLRQEVSRILQGWLHPRMGFPFALAMLAVGVFFFSWTKHSKAEVHAGWVSPKFPSLIVACPYAKDKWRFDFYWLRRDGEGSEARRFRAAREPGEASHTSLVGMQVGEPEICFRPLTKVPWQLELCWQPPLKGKESVRQERWNMFHCHPPHSVNGWPSILPSATFPSGEKMEELSLML